MYSSIRRDRIPSARLGPDTPGDTPTGPDPLPEFRPAPISGRLRRSAAAVADPLGGSPIPTDIQQFLRRSRGGGEALPTGLGAAMGEELGADLGSVRVHTGPESDAAARALQATAFTVGTDLHFRRGTYSPTTVTGQRLLAHEVSHVAQQGPGVSAPSIGRADDAAEHAADKSADRIVGALRRRSAPPVLHADGDLVAANWQAALPRQRTGAASDAPIRRVVGELAAPTDEKALTTLGEGQITTEGAGPVDVSPKGMVIHESLRKLVGEAQREKIKELLRTSHPDKGGSNEEFQDVMAAVKWLRQQTEPDRPTKLITSGESKEDDPPVLAAAPGKLDFDWTWFEVRKFPEEVEAAIKQFSRSSDAIEHARELLLPRMNGELQAWFTIQMNRLVARMSSLAGRKIPTAERPQALAAVTAISSDLAQLLTAAADRIAEAERMTALAAQQEVARQQREEAARVAAEEERAEQEKKVREEEAAREKVKKEAAEAKAKQEEAEKAEQAAAAKKAEQEQVAAEAAATEKKKQDDDEKAADEAKEVEAKRLQQLKEDRAKAEKERADKKAAEQKQLDDEAARRDQEELDNKATFGNRTAGFDAAVKVGDSLAAFDYEAKIKQLDAALAKAEKEAADLAKKARKKGGQGKSRTKSAQPLPVEEEPAPAEDTPTPQSEHAAGLAEAKGRRADSVNQTVSKLGAVATSIAGQELSDADLAWVLSESKGSVELAGGLAELIGHQPHGLAVAKKLVSGFDVRRLAPVCGRLLDDQAPADLVPETAALLEECESKPYRRPFRMWLWGCVRNGTLKSALELCRPFSDTLGTVALAAPVLGFKDNTGIFLQIMQRCKAKPADIATLLALSTATEFEQLLLVMRNKNLSAEDVCRVMTPVHLARFTLLELVKLCDTWPRDLELVAELLPLAEPNCPSLIGLLINVGELGRKNELLVIALQAEAQLLDKVPTFSITIEKPDVHYRGPEGLREHNTNVGARTGFLHLNFGATVKNVHTHWDSVGSKKGLINSMKVKDIVTEERGLDLKKWMQFFQVLPKTVIATQNSGTPRGGPVRL